MNEISAKLKKVLAFYFKNWSKFWAIYVSKSSVKTSKVAHIVYHVKQ